MYTVHNMQIRKQYQKSEVGYRQICQNVRRPAQNFVYSVIKVLHIDMFSLQGYACGPYCANVCNCNYCSIGVQLVAVVFECRDLIFSQHIF
jgi:hypothetical protein